MNKLNELQPLADQERLERIDAAVKATHNLIKTCLGDDNADRNFDYFEVIMRLSLNALIAASRLSGEIGEEVANTFFKEITSRIRTASPENNRLHS